MEHESKRPDGRHPARGRRPLPSFFDTAPAVLSYEPEEVYRAQQQKHTPRVSNADTTAGAHVYSHHAWCSWCRATTFHGHVAHWHRYAVPLSAAAGLAIWSTVVAAWSLLASLAAVAAASWTVLLALAPFCWSVAYMAVMEGRDEHQCQVCTRRTLSCRTCASGMARGGAALFNAQCCDRCTGATTAAPLTEHPSWLPSDAEVMVEFAPPRRNVQVRPLIDGEEFLAAAADAIDGARSSVFMSFWHMSDKIYLRRHVDEQGRPELHERDRFDRMIQRKAREGVQVFIILWREKSRRFWLDNFSEEMQAAFEALHPNVHVLRHGHPAFGFTLWSHHQKFVVVDRAVAIVGGFDVCLGRYDTPHHALWDCARPGDENDDPAGAPENNHDVDDPAQDHDDAAPPFQMWPGADYYNPHVTRPESIVPFFRDSVDRQRVQRMPWHDVDVMVTGEAARDVALTFVQRWNHHAQELGRSNVPRLEERTNDEDTSGSSEHRRGSCTAQVVRSMGPWSGSKAVDLSLYEAHMRMIHMAQHFIYIENQYYATSMAGNAVCNQLGHALLIKLREMIRARRPFRVIFMVPMPEETGEGALTILHWLYRSVNRGGSSLLEQLRREFPHVQLSDYLCFCFPRQVALATDERPAVTEKIYLHSKLMIVDDNVAIVSSANLNDRSLLGDRDSELGVVYEDTDKVETTLGGRTVRVSRSVRDFRLRLWREHLGLLDHELDSEPVTKLWDVCDDAVYHDTWVATAQRNTAIFERVFPTIPQNRHRTLKRFEAEDGLLIPAPVRGDASELADIRGTLTLHPIEFMIEDHIETKLEKFIGHRSSQ